MKKIVFILFVFCNFLVVCGCTENITKCVPQKAADSDTSIKSNDDTLSLMIEHGVDDVDYGVIIKPQLSQVNFPRSNSAYSCTNIARRCEFPQMASRISSL